MNKKIVAVIAVLLMIFSMFLYIASEDESIEPVADGPAVDNPADESMRMPAAE